MSQLTLTLIQLGFLALLWFMVLSVASVMRSDLFARRRAKSSARADARAARSAAKASAKAGTGTRPTPAARPKPGRGSPRQLVVTAGAQSGLSVELGATPITIGRAEENTIALDDDYVSGRHARVYPHEGSWVVEDLGSTNGTFLGTTKVTSPTVIPSSGTIRIGKSELKLRK
ncbi:MAG: FHA domain-containing protein [Actinomycetia bacterium]|nr:FHA domain-containing protein [Actinomycetes bacterium]